jgi:hypothetical protein
VSNLQISIQQYREGGKQKEEHRMNNDDTEQELMIRCSICDKQFREPKEKDLAVFKWSTDELSTVSYSFCMPCAEMVGDIIEAIASRREQKDNEE